MYIYICILAILIWKDWYSKSYGFENQTKLISES